MKRRGTFGFLFICVSLALALLFFSIKVSFFKTIQLFEGTLKAPPYGEPYNFFNFTLNSENVPDKIKITIQPYYMVDFWVVNSTGLEQLETCLSWGETFRMFYPDKGPFNGIKAYVRGVNVTDVESFELVDFSGNIIYHFVLLNFFDDYQPVHASIEKVYIEPPRSLLISEPFTPALTVVIFFIGIFLIMTRRGKVRKLRAKFKVNYFIEFF